MAKNMISLFGAVKVNGLLIANPYSFFQDANIAQIVWVHSPTTIQNAQGNDITAFQVMYVEPQSLTYTTFYLPTRVGLTTLANFKTGLTTINAGNLFTIYTSLVKSSDQASTRIPAGVDMMFGDNHMEGEQYLNSSGQTVVSVNIKNRLIRTNFFFSGNQTYAGQYLYFKSDGNT